MSESAPTSPPRPRPRSNYHLYFLGLGSILFILLQAISAYTAYKIQQAEVEAKHRADFLIAIGYSGLIHNFKNCVLRPAEPGYCAAADADAAKAERYFENIEANAGDDPDRVDLTDLRATIEAYRRNLALIPQLHARGLSVAEVDAAVRIDDRAAAGDLAELQTRVAEQLLEQSETLRLRVWVSGLMAGALLLTTLGALVLLVRREHRAQTAKLAEENVHIANRLEAVLNAARSGVIGIDKQGLIVSANPQARHILGVPDAPTPFHWPADIVFLDRETAQPQEASQNPVNRAMAGQILRSETSLMTRVYQGEPRFVRVSSSTVESSAAQDVATVIVLDDVSEQEKHRQRIERSSRLDALGQLTGGIAHDFNNLLATIGYSVEIAQLRLSSLGVTAADDHLGRTLSAIRRGAALTTRLLAFAKRQPGLAKSQRVADTIADFELLASPTIEESIRLEFADCDGDLWVYCDPAQLENALLNLVLNSRDAITRSGKGAQIVVKARGVTEVEDDILLRKENPHSYITMGLRAKNAANRERQDNRAYRFVEISVTDDGPGMTEEVKRRAIDPFFTTKEVNSGTGLGLSIVYGFVQQSDGELRIYSEVGHGTAVSLILPRGAVSGGREEPVERLPAPRGGGQRILVVEDEPPLLEIMSEMIEALGYRVVQARSGREAMEILERGEAIDLLLTDVVMPGGVGGFELAKQVRAKRPEIRILYMSGYTGFSEAEMGPAPAPMIQKPCPPADFARALETALASE